MISPTLPRYATRLIGRAQSESKLSELLLRPDIRMVTMTGASGTGKTRLGLQVAETLGAHFYDGRYFAALAPVTAPRFVVPTIAQALGVKERGGQRLLASVTAWLAGQKILLILDNFEQVQAAVADVDAILEQTDNVKILVTSQVPLGSSHEAVFEVPPLAYPEPGSAFAPDGLSDYSAVALFVDRIRAMQPGFRLTPQDGQAIVEICQLVQGLPLAIELIAAHSARLAPADLLVFVRNHLALGSHRRQSAPVTDKSVPVPPGRQHILYPVLDWCHSRLTTAQQALFGRMGVFAGGCTTEAVRAIYDHRGAAATTLQQDMATLQDKHLVLEETLPGHEPHYIMLDAIREYAHQRLSQRKERVQIAQAHTDYYVRWSELARDGSRGDDQARWSARFHSEIHNLRSVMQRALAQREAAALEIASNTAIHWYRQGYPMEGREWLRLALAQREGAPPLSLARGLYSMGLLCFAQSDYAAARPYLDEAAGIQRGAGSEGLAGTLGLLGLVTTYAGRYAEAEQFYGESLALARANNQPHQAMVSQANLGFALINQGDADRAEQTITEAHAVALATGDQFGLALLRKNFGEIALLRGRSADARQHAEESLDRLRKLNNRGTFSLALNLLALIMVEQGELARARDLILESATLQQEMGNDRGVIEALEVGPLLLDAAGHPGQAACLFQTIQRERRAAGVAQTSYVRQRYDQLARRLGKQAADAEPLSVDAALRLLSELAW